MILGLGVCLSLAQVQALVFNRELTTVSQVQPGDVLTGKIVVTNNKDIPEVINLRQVDYKYNWQGENFFEESGSLPRSNALWIELPRTQFTVQPKETKEFLYTLRIPKDNILHGSYASTILVEPESFAVPTVYAAPSQGIGLNVKIRYAHQVVTTLGTPKALLKVIGSSLKHGESGLLFHVDVVNCGECYLYPKAVLKIFDNAGRLVQCSEAPPCSIMPDNSVRFTLHLTHLEPKIFTAFLLLDDGHDHIFGEKITLNYTAENKNAG
jgi:hypothetical protein